MIRDDCGIRADQGSATVWALTVVLVIWAGAGFAAVQATAIQLRHRADAVADAVALAGASEGGRDPAAACADARAAARQQRARLLSCLVAGPVVTVEVSLSPPQPLAWAGAVRSRARAGPANTGLTEGTRPIRLPS